MALLRRFRNAWSARRSDVVIIAGRSPANPAFGLPPVIAAAGADWVAGQIKGSAKAPIPPMPASWQPSAFDPNFNRGYRDDPTFQALEAQYVAATGFPGFSMEEFLDARVAGHPSADTSRKYVWRRVQENIRDRNDPAGLAAAEALLDYFRPAGTGGGVLTAGFGGGGGVLPLVAIAAALLLLSGKKF